MAKLPTRNEISPQPSGRSGRVIAEYDTSAIGRGMQQLGAGIADLGVSIGRSQTAQEGIAADGSALREMNDYVRSFDEDGDYATFGKRADEGLRKIGEKYASKITDRRARERWLAEYNLKAEGKRNQIADLGERKVREQRLVDAKSGLEGYQTLISDTNLSEDERTSAKRNADASIAALEQDGMLSPSEAQQWRESVISGGDFVYGQREIEKDPSIISGKLPARVSDRASMAMKYFQERGWSKEQAAGIVGNLIAESSLNTGARNAGDGSDGSDSIGIGQWNSDRARALKEFAALNRADWRDFNVQLAFVQHELENNESSAGAQLRNASDVQQATEAMIMYERPSGSQKGAKNAHNYNGRLRFAQQAAGETIRPDWYLSQTPENQLKLERIAEARNNEIVTQQAAQQKVLQQQANDDYRLRIAVSDPTLTQQDIINDTRLDNGDKATLINSFNQEAETNAGVQAIIGAISSGQSVAVNSFDATESKIAEKAYQRYVGSVGDDQRALAADSFIRSTGYIPKSLEADIRAGASSTSPEAVATTMQSAVNLSKLAPVGFASMTGVDDLRKKMDLYESYTQTMGLDPLQAAEKVISSNDPEQQRRRDAILKSEPVKKLLQGVNSNDVAAIFDKGIFSRSPDVGGTVSEGQIQVGVNPISEAAIVADYKRILEDAIVESDGDQTVAKDVASKRFQTVYGTTAFSPLSSNVVVRYPPEKAYPAGPDGSHEWVREQAVEALKGEGINAADIFLSPLPDGGTEKDIRAGKPARYQIFYTDQEHGTLESLNLPFYADPQVMMQQFEQKKQEIRQQSEQRMLENRSEEMKPGPRGFRQSVTPAPQEGGPSVSVTTDRNSQNTPANLLGIEERNDGPSMEDIRKGAKSFFDNLTSGSKPRRTRGGQ